MKNLILISSFLISSIVFSQVGINTENPFATLDVTSSPDDLTTVDGVLIPKLTGDELKSKDDLYTEDQHGVLVFVTEIPDPVTDKTSLITSQGFYYYNSEIEKWVTFSSSEPWNVRNTDNQAVANIENIYQTGNVAVGTKYGQGTFHVDAQKNNTANSASVSEMLDDVLVHQTGRVYVGAKPNDLLLLAGVEDKIKVAANQDLDVDYDLATSTNSQCIVHRNIISSGTMDNRGPRNKITSIASFEGHTYQTPTLSNNFSWYQQRAGIVLRTGRITDNGGEIWFGTAGTPPNYTGANPKTNWYRAVMDERGFWAYGADPNGESYAQPTERLDILYGGMRIRQINTPNYTSSSATDRVVVVDANGVLKSKPASELRSNANPTATATIAKISSNQSIQSSTTLIDAASSDLVIRIEADQEFDGNTLILKKVDLTQNSVTIKSATNRSIDAKEVYTLGNSMEGVMLQYFENQWFVVGKF